MKIKEITVRKAKRSTLKSQTGDYNMSEADISLTVEAENGVLNESEVIDRVKALVLETLNDDPRWMDEKQPNETTSPSMGSVSPGL